MEREKIDYAAWIGLDWGSYKHAICLQPADSGPIERCTLEQKPEALHGWFMNLLARFDGRKVAVAIEQTRGAVIHFLLGLDSVQIFPIHPKSLKNYRDALHPSGAKDDPTDAELLLQFLKLHQDRIKPWIPDEPEVRLLLRLVEFRRKSVGKRVRLTNELTQLLKEYFPAAVDCAGDLDKVMACDFLLRWPTLEELQKSQPETIRTFYQEHNSRRRDVIENRLKQIRSALPLTTDAPVIEPSVLMVQSLASQLLSVIDAISQFDQRIREVFQKHPDAPIFSSFPGAGSALAPRLLAAMGSDRSRFSSSLEVAEYSGIAPVTECSGKKTWVHRRYACSQFVKQTFHEFAAQSILFCSWARCYYDRKKTEGKQHHSAIRALAYRWIRIIYRCWKDRVPYDEDKYIKALRQRKPAWLESLTPPVNLKTSEHASSRYGYVDPTVRRFAPDTRADRCALILKRILRCCPSEDSSIRLALDQSPRAHQTCSVTRQSLFLGMDRTLPGNHPLCSRNNAATRVVFEGKLQNNVLLAEHLRCLSAVQQEGPGDSVPVEGGR